LAVGTQLALENIASVRLHQRTLDRLIAIVSGIQVVTVGYCFLFNVAMIMRSSMWRELSRNVFTEIRPTDAGGLCFLCPL
jgi:hypothetical protein